MITKATMNYGRRNFFGIEEQVSESREWDIERKHVLKAINFVLKTDDFVCAHFDRDGGCCEGGTHDAIWQESDQRGTDRLTWRHWSSNNSSDDTVVTASEFRAMSREWSGE